MAKYVFDSNIFMNLQRRQPIDIYPSLWNKIGELMTSGIIISSQEVYDEIAVGGDELEKWVKSRKEYFLPSDVAIQSEVRTILQNYRGLVEGGKKKNSADPFVIALAKENQCTLVTEEKINGNKDTPKIPDICDVYDIKCVDFVTFSREEKLSF
ncbi:MAG: DUF4411 family protein [Lachnospiraceae bacterium]|nr:DUF4411 family protein [Lachnospiraceae bacterium]